MLHSFNVNHRYDWYDHQCNFFANRWTSYMEFLPHLYLSKPHSRFPCAVVHSGFLAGSYLDLPHACFPEPKWIASQVASDPGWNCWNLPMVHLYLIHKYIYIQCKCWCIISVTMTIVVYIIFISLCVFVFQLVQLKHWIEHVKRPNFQRCTNCTAEV